MRNNPYEELYGSDDDERRNVQENNLDPFPFIARPNRRRNFRAGYTSRVSNDLKKTISINQWENFEENIIVEEFADSPEFTTSVLVDFNRLPNRIAIRMQPISERWTSVHARLVVSRGGISTGNNVYPMISVDNNDALYVALHRPADHHPCQTTNIELVFSTERASNQEQRPTEHSKTSQSAPFKTGDMYMNEEFSDFTVVCAFQGEEKVSIPIHKVIVGKCSPYFKALFDPTNTVENQNGAVTLTEVPYNVMKEVLHYIYFGRMSENVSGICADVVKAADYFQITDLRDQCLKRVGKTVDRSNVLDLICLSYRFETNNKLAAKAKEFIDTYMTKEEATALYTTLIYNYPDEAVHFFVST